MFRNDPEQYTSLTDDATDRRGLATGSAQTAPFLTPVFMRHNSLSSNAGSTISLGSEGHRPEHSLINKYQLPTDPRQWEDYSGPEADDILHNPGKEPPSSVFVSWRGVANLGCIALLMVGIVSLFAGYPVITFFTRKHPAPVVVTQAQNLNLRTNSSGDIPSMKGKWRLIDNDTPASAYQFPSYMDGSEMTLIFSDEFNTDGRTFYPGDDPFWEALDLHYWQTGDLEWYDPAAITTKDGALVITFQSKDTHGLNYQGGMLTSWNNFCFTGGLVVVGVQLPGVPTISGYWPAVWTMGNLGRVGYGATTDGLWPYSYDTCDYGTVKNQTIGDQPPGALIPGMGDPYNGDAFSYLPGQRLSRCSCKGSTHPGPMHEDGSYVGRAAPEIDLFEATAGGGGGNLSQSVQAAPFNQGYFFFNGTGTYDIYDADLTSINGYHGGAYQEAISALSIGNQTCYQGVDDCFAIYGVEYKPGLEADNAYITWIGNGQKTWTLNAAALAKDDRVSIGPRPVSQEPMYIIANLGMSPSFQRVSTDLPLPGIMKIDYVRVYQRPDSINYGCDPKDFPTMDYIAEFEAAYTNPNYTLWSDIGQTFPGNSFLNQCTTAT